MFCGEYIINVNIDDCYCFDVLEIMVNYLDGNLEVSVVYVD